MSFQPSINSVLSQGRYFLKTRQGKRGTAVERESALCLRLNMVAGLQFLFVFSWVLVSCVGVRSPLPWPWGTTSRQDEGFVCKIDEKGGVDGAGTCGEVDMRGVSSSLVAFAIKVSSLKHGRCASYGYCRFSHKQSVDCGPILGSRLTFIYEKGGSRSPARLKHERNLAHFIRSALRACKNVLAPDPCCD